MGFFSPSFMQPRSASQGSDFWETRWKEMRRHSRTGVVVDQRAALNLSAVLCATRVISEAISSLPLNLIEQVDEDRRRIATDHPLQTMLHDQPNPEQDSMGWFDQLIPWQVNAGTGFAEKEADSNGNVIALWPIHPSRVPPSNRKRNPRTGPRPDIGDYGEMVFHVRNDDGTLSPIPASRMLVVPGVLSEDGVCGRGLIELGCESLGVAMAVEQHAGAFFRNGAVPGVFVNYEGKLSAEKFDLLRASFEKRHEGVDNHYRSMLIDGAKASAQILGVDPEKTQLLGARNFNIAEVSRIWRVPLHMLSDLSRATWSNIESQGIEFVVHSLRPWIVRWERAMNRQLLTPDERERYYFRFNLNALMRGDSTARASYYQTMQQLGVYSINEIRELEDLDPIDNGDVRFIPANNMQPLDSVGETTTLDGNDASSATDWPDHATDSLELIAPIIAGRRVASAAITHTFDNLVRYEVRRLEHAAKKPGEFMAWMDEFYGTAMPETITSTAEPVVVTLATLGVMTSGVEIAAHYCEQSRAALDGALNQPAATFAAKVKEITDGWSGRAATLTIELMGGA